MRNIHFRRLKTLCLAILFSASSSVFADEDEPSEDQIAPDFSITTLDGEKFNLKDHRGKHAVYLVFWNTWCTYCMKKIPKLKHAQDKLSDKIKIIAVNTGLKDSVEKSFAFEKRFEINYPLAFDHGKKVTDLYGVWGTPTEFIIDINGIIRHRDGVPDSIEANLTSWNTLISEEESLVSSSQCNNNQQTC